MTGNTLTKCCYDNALVNAVAYAQGTHRAPFLEGALSGSNLNAVPCYDA